MDTNLLQLVSLAALIIGLVMTGLGGLGLFREMRARKRKDAEHEFMIIQLHERLETLERMNEELGERIAFFEMTIPTPKTEALVPEVPFAVVPEPLEKKNEPWAIGRPMLIPRRQPAPPLKNAETAVWAGEDLLEDLIVSTMEPDEAPRHEKQVG